MLKQVSVRISGRVQGVFFRASTKEKADEFGLSGFVRNEPDGGVYLEAEGDERQIEKLVTWCKTGPPRAIVDRIDVTYGDPKGLSSFEVQRRF